MGKLCSKSSSKPFLITRRETRKETVKSQSPAGGQLWQDLSGTYTSIPGPIFLKFFINDLDGEQGNTQFADGAEMGVVTDILRVITS